MINKFLTKVLVGIFAISCFMPLLGVKTAKAEMNEPTPIDMYLIAGQSNAAGYSPIKNNETEEFENVMYAGLTEKVLRGKDITSPYTNSNTLTSFESFKTSVTAGLGNISDRIGPEYGIAKQINDMYADSDRKAIIFKVAAGGTSLLDQTEELSERYGNWYPRSLWEDGYTPNISEFSNDNDATGLLYELFVENFRHVYNELVENNYAPTVKGMAWMQGCTDIDENLTEYAETLKVFISDIRTDLAEITGDNSLAAMPFVIGEIAETFNGNPNANAIKMDACQRQVAEEMGSSVETISTSDLIITGTDGNPMPGCPDKFHFCFADAVTLGIRFGQKILELNGQKLVTTLAQNGQLRYELNEDGSVRFQCVPNEHYKLEKLIVADEDVTAAVQDGGYTLLDSSMRIYAEAVFVQKNTFDLTYSDLGDGAGYLRKAKYWYEGETLAIKIFVNEGYVLEQVTFNGEEIPYNEQTGEYELVVTETGKIDAVVKKVKTGNDNSGNGSSPVQVGCVASVGMPSLAVVMLVGLVTILVKRKEN